MPDQPTAPPQGARIRKVRHPDRFLRIDQQAVRDRRLSFRARGLLAYLLDRPDGWRFTAESLALEATEGRDAIRTALSELEAVGYLARDRIRRDDGTFFWEVEVREEPTTRGKPAAGSPQEVSQASYEGRRRTTDTNPPPSEGAGAELALLPAPPKERNPQAAAVAAWVEGWSAASSDPPTSRARGQVAREAAQLLADGYPPERVEQLARQAGGKGWASLVREAEASARDSLPQRGRGSWEARTSGLAAWASEEGR